MTFKTTVRDANTQQPIQAAAVFANDEFSGLSFSRGTDGGGYADVAMFNVPNNRQITLLVISAGYANGVIYLNTGDGADQTVDVSLVPSFKKPFKPAPRFWRGNMCGVRIAGLPPVDGGNPAIPELVLSWFYDRYISEDRTKITNDWDSKTLTHVLTSWPDSRAFGYTADGFINTQKELLNRNFYPCPFLCSKDFDPHDADAIIANWQQSQILEKIVASNVPLACIGWELSIWLSPTDVQKLIDYACPILTPKGIRVYVHFQEGYMSFPEPNHDNASFWNKQVGKLTGVLYQKRLVQNDAEFLDSIYDCLIRMAGGFNMPADSGFGHPFDFVALELDSVYQFDGRDSEQDGNRWGQVAINAPAVTGPTGVIVNVMGAGNGL